MRHLRVKPVNVSRSNGYKHANYRFTLVTVFMVVCIMVRKCDSGSFLFSYLGIPAGIPDLIYNVNHVILAAIIFNVFFKLGS